MALQVLTFQEFVDNQASIMKAASPFPLNFTAGSVINALIQGNAGNSLWLQALATTLLAATRLSTSSGVDCDTFCADFGFYRNQGNAASGTVTFSRFTATVAGVVAVGSIVATSGTNVTYTVIANNMNPNFVAPSVQYPNGSYVVPISTTSMDVPVVCNVPGTLGNAIIGAIDTIQNNPPATYAIDTVNNAAALTNGRDPWDDTLFKQNFVLYINSLSRATLQAIQYAVTISTTPNEVVTRYNIVENVNESNVPQLGYFYVVIDNGTMTTCSNALKDAVSANVNLYRGLTIQYNIDKTLFTDVIIVINAVKVAQPTETDLQIEANVKSAIQAYTQSIPFNQPFLFSKIAETVYNSDPNIASIPSSPGITLDGMTVDVAGDNLHVFRAQTANITVNLT